MDHNNDTFVWNGRYDFERMIIVINGDLKSCVIIHLLLLVDDLSSSRNVQSLCDLLSNETFNCF